MATTPVRSLASHIATVAHASFRSMKEAWTFTKGLPTGCRKLMKLIENTTGAHHKPVNPAYLLNEDYSSQYYFAGPSRKNNINNTWERITEESLFNRNKDFMWCEDNDDSGICKGIRVKFACGGSAAGFIYPIYIIVSQLSIGKFPSNDFVVVLVEGLSINCHIDPRNREIGCMRLVRENVPQREIFE